MGYMKKDFEKIISSYGHDIFLQRRTQNPKEIPTYSDTLEIHTVRINSILRGAVKAEQELPEGIVNTSERIYFFKADALPFEGDRIYEYDERAFDKSTVWVIDSAIPMRGTGGEIVFWTVGATRLRPN